MCCAAEPSHFWPAGELAQLAAAASAPGDNFLVYAAAETMMAQAALKLELRGGFGGMYCPARGECSEVISRS